MFPSHLFYHKRWLNWNLERLQNPHQCPPQRSTNQATPYPSFLPLNWWKPLQGNPSDWWINSFRTRLTKLKNAGPASDPDVESTFGKAYLDVFGRRWRLLVLLAVDRRYRSTFWRLILRRTLIPFRNGKFSACYHEFGTLLDR